VERIVRDEGFRKWIVENAYKKCLENYDWDQIAEQTLGIYNRVFREWNAGDWKPK
jgi:glycosyltransferase involved in cell wall biosynthesis